jgi:hypothetical protein
VQQHHRARLGAADHGVDDLLDAAAAVVLRVDGPEHHQHAQVLELGERRLVVGAVGRSEHRSWQSVGRELLGRQQHLVVLVGGRHPALRVISGGLDPLAQRLAPAAAKVA